MIRESDRKLPDPRDMIKVHEIGPGEIFKDASVRVFAAENTHFHFQEGTPAYGKTQSLSYRFEISSKVVTFTGDTGPSSAVEKLANNSDVLVSEIISADDYLQAMQSLSGKPLSDEQKERNVHHMSEEHLTPDKVGKLAEKAHVKKVVLTHFPPRFNGPSDFSDYIPLVKQYYSGDVVASRDGFMLNLSE